MKFLSYVSSKSFIALTFTFVMFLKLFLYISGWSPTSFFPVISALFIEIILSSFNCLGPLIVNTLRMNMRDYFSITHYLPLINTSTHMSVQYCFVYYRCILAFEIRKQRTSAFVLSFQDYFCYYSPFAFPNGLIQMD